MQKGWLCYGKNLEALWRTDVGRQRNRTKDQFLIADLLKSMLIETVSLNSMPSAIVRQVIRDDY